MLSTLPFVLLAATVVRAQADGHVPDRNRDPTDPTEPRLTGKRFPFDALPEKIDRVAKTDEATYRGEQTGYNNCNGRATSNDAMCQTLVVDSIGDFCIFAPPTPNTVGAAEFETVAFCTQPTHGARLIPPGALQSVQFLRAPSYIAITGRINQTMFNILNVDGNGGELDSGGPDMRGNPLGAAAYSRSLPNSGGKMTQSVVWHEFMGNNHFCMKLCDDKSANPRGLCRHTLDTYGCDINVPNSFPDGFLSCDSDDQAPVAVGVTDIPASSNCVPYASAALYGANPTSVPIPTTTPPAPTSTVISNSASASTTSAPTTSPSGSTTRPATTTTPTVRPAGTNTQSSAPSGTDAPDSASSAAASIFALTFAGLFALAVMA